MNRYQCTEMTASGWGRRYWTEALSTARTIAASLGGDWYIVRQYRHANGRWHRDGGRQPGWVRP